MTLLTDLDAGTLDPAAFSHRDHLRAGYLMLREAPFFRAAARYEAALQGLTRRAGAPEKYSATLTFAWLSLIAEAMARHDPGEVEAFLAAHPGLGDPAQIASRYSPARLAEPGSRRAPRLPDRAP